MLMGFALRQFGVNECGAISAAVGRQAQADGAEIKETLNECIASCISGIGVLIPEAAITNEELVESFNAYVDLENARRAG